jgi:hypothetical protein
LIAAPVRVIGALALVRLCLPSIRERLVGLGLLGLGLGSGLGLGFGFGLGLGFGFGLVLPLAARAAARLDECDRSRCLPGSPYTDARAVVKALLAPAATGAAPPSRTRASLSAPTPRSGWTPWRTRRVTARSPRSSPIALVDCEAHGRRVPFSEHRLVWTLVRVYGVYLLQNQR